MTDERSRRVDYCERVPLLSCLAPPKSSMSIPQSLIMTGHRERLCEDRRRDERVPLNLHKSDKEQHSFTVCGQNNILLSLLKCSSLPISICRQSRPTSACQNGEQSSSKRHREDVPGEDGGQNEGLGSVYKASPAVIYEHTKQG